MNRKFGVCRGSGLRDLGEHGGSNLRRHTKNIIRGVGELCDMKGTPVEIGSCAACRNDPDILLAGTVAYYTL
jgi:hypothetical protein